MSSGGCRLLVGKAVSSTTCSSDSSIAVRPSGNRTISWSTAPKKQLLIEAVVGQSDESCSRILVMLVSRTA